ncbi:MAG: hypothetical protein D6702_11985 [Planctomycetota bacterium]|nr:MAG: hypothetical protein D6702_11985 [Planctomycetota bacterium]
MLAALLLLLGSVPAQEPPAAVQRNLDARDPVLRAGAAMDVADLGQEVEAWLLDQRRRGSAARRRAVLLSLALLGTPAALEAVEEAARPRVRPREYRAFALLLYGAFHPEAPARADELGASLHSAEERNLLLAGLLAQAQRWSASPDWARADREREPATAALALLGDALAARFPDRLPESASGPEWSALLLASCLPGGPALPATEIELRSGDSLPLWREAARHRPPRGLDEIRRSALAGSGGIAFGLGEVEDADRKAAFELLDQRLQDGAARSWLWGTAGDLGLALPEEPGELETWRVGGLLRLALRDPVHARRTAEAWRARARRLLAETDEPESVFRAAAVLALAPEENDLETLRRRVAGSSGRSAQRLHAVWQVAQGRASSGAARRRFLREWSRDLRAGYLGYLDREIPRYLAHLLVGGTRAAEENSFLGGALPGLAGPHEEPLDSEFYADLLAILALGIWRPDLP